MDLVMLLNLSAIISLISLTFSVHAFTDVLELGSSLTPASQPLLSASSNFTLSFRDPAPLSKPSTLFLAIYFFVDSSPNNPVWVANRNTSVSVSASLNLSSSGDLQLLTNRSVSSSLVWSSNTADRGVVRAQLLDTGNLVLLNDRGEHVWQSFHYPTDTILSGQEFSVNSTALMSSKKIGDFEPGRYSFNVTSVHRYELLLVTMGNISAMQFDDIGNITFYGSDTTSGSMTTRTTVSNDYGVSSSMRRMTLDVDGNLRLYTWDVSSAQWTAVWMLIWDLCILQRPGVCGSYGVCTYDPFEPKCVCLQGFSVVDPTDLSAGCTSPFVATADKCNASTKFKFQELENVNFLPDTNDFLFLPTLSIEECKNECLNSCKCLAAVYTQQDYTGQYCLLLQKVENGYVQMDQANRVFLKVLASGPLVSSPIVDRATRWKLGQYLWQPLVSYIEKPIVYSSTIIALVVLIIIEGICFAATVAGLLIRSKRKLKLAQLGEELEGGPRIYSYQDLKVATDNFRHKLGEGGFGSVYKGQLQNGKRIAVKLLEGMLQQEKQFRAEIRTIGRIHHINLLRLVGFCSEGSHRLLVYEYMEKGSLDQFLLQEISGSGTGCRDIEVMDWSTRFSICLGVAKGIHYLHEGCLNCILHCDIKPHNVLLDGSYCAKVADFGLAYLHNRDQTVEMTTIRGTRGYLAPEWISNLPITAKADVFSYGMLIMEIISGRSNYLYTNSSAPVKDKVNEKSCFPMWAYGKRIQDVVDAKLQETLIDWKQADMVLKVAFACIQEDMNARPTMGQVLQMLEGVLPLPLDLSPPSLIPTDKGVGAALSLPPQVFSITKSSSASRS